MRKKLKRGLNAVLDRVLNRPRPSRGERQVAPTIDGIRADHVARYRFAATLVKPGAAVLDMACGVGYGTKMLADVHKTVHILGIDASPEAIEYGCRYFASPNAEYRVADALTVDLPPHSFDLIVSFETIEHLADAERFLRRVHQFLKPDGLLVCSTPNEDVIPFNPAGFPFHIRHYRVKELETLLEDCGYTAREWYSQPDKRSPAIVPNTGGAFTIAVAGPRQA